MDYLIISRSNMEIGQKLGVVLLMIGLVTLFVLIEDNFSLCHFGHSLVEKECWYFG
tara:strand:+ start:499 stop:666 length:168 start_codon:yes stop_codon:yes gene_type:complete